MGWSDAAIFGAIWIALFFVIRNSATRRLTSVQAAIVAGAFAALIVLSSYIKYGWHPF
jgi:hypothetical protein